MRDLLGIEPAGHPDARPLVRHGFWPETFYPLRHDAVAPTFHDDGRPFPFTEVAGDGVYEIPVGPVHAGVIEPGHFRFNVLGETILKMRARLYFTHKGTERLLLARRPIDALPLIERVSGDTSVGHAVAFCQAVEALADVEISRSAAAARVVLLELERLYNHVADVGAIIGDTGYPIGQAHCLRLREELLRLNKEIVGHRLLRGVVVPGGVLRQRALQPAVVAAVSRVVRDFEDVVQICRDNTLVADRLEGTGRLSVEVARDFGVVGYVARACGLPHDTRNDLPFAAYRWLGVTPVVAQAGDVEARLDVRVREVRQAFEIIEQAVSTATSTECRTDVGTLPAWTAAFGVVEAWRGRLVHMVMADEDGRLHRVKIVDPSFFNWPALARALDGNIVPDFPLCNKSFNASYSGNDL
jgi:Ni,Fe-hydrogenase III large subunit